MQRDPHAYLWDVSEATDAILSFVADVSFDQYATTPLLYSAVERQFEIIGEALNQLSKAAPTLADRIPGLAQIVAFRNLLMHGYATVDHPRVWRTIHESLPALRVTVKALLDELELL